MTNKKLLMFAVAGLVSPVAFQGVANAEVHNSQVTVMIPAPTKDLAPVNTVTNPDGTTTKRLRRTDQNQPGEEMPAYAFFADGKSGLYFAMSTELNGVRAQNKMQLSLTKFTLSQDPATGAVAAVADQATAKFVTTNNGNERRNANAPTAMAINGGTAVCAEYNYQPNGTNDTVRYIQCFDQAGKTIMPQTKAYAKNNDDCSMHQDGEPGAVVSFDKTTNTTKLVAWRGCNGNGTDDGWLQVASISCDSATAPTKCSFAQNFDVSLAAREERSRGRCTVDAKDTSYTVCSWTEGNNQPQRDGTWLAAVDLTTKKILWKNQIGGRIDNNPAAANQRTYAQRATHERIMVMNAATNQLEPSDTLIYRYGDARGNNNTNEGKGGTYVSNMLSVIKVSRAGLTYVAKPVDMNAKLLGLGGTHLGAAAAMFGTTDHLMPGLVFMNGSHTGGVTGAQLRSVGLDTATNTFSDLGMTEIAPHDRHLYPNYLGNNPGNQGRNHSELMMISNPYVGQAGNTDAYLMVAATTGKTMADANNAAIKLTAFLTVTGIAQTPHGAGTGTGGGTGSGTTGGDPSTGTGTDPGTDGSSDPGTTLGGCSAGGTSTGLASFLLIGLAAFIRRRR
jgi:hypothetical protein